MKIKLNEKEIMQALIDTVVSKGLFPAKGEFRVDVLTTVDEGVVAEISFTPYTHV